MKKNWIVMLSVVVILGLCIGQTSSWATEMQFPALSLSEQWVTLNNQAMKVVEKMKLKQEEYKEHKQVDSKILEEDKAIKRDERLLKEEINDFDRTVHRDYQQKYIEIQKEYSDHGCRSGGRTTDTALWNWCNAKADKLNTLTDDFERQRAPFGDRIKKIMERREALNNKTYENAAKIKRCNADFAQLQAELRGIYDQMTTSCKEILNKTKMHGKNISDTKKLEALKHNCGNIQFDLANPKLPSLEDMDIKPPFQMIPR